jgi:hypothetical protein
MSERVDDLEAEVTRLSSVVGTLVLAAENPHISYFTTSSPNDDVCTACRAEPCAEHGGPTW